MQGKSVIKNNINSQLENHLNLSLKACLGHRLEDHLGASVRLKVGDRLEDHLEGSRKGSVEASAGGDYHLKVNPCGDCDREGGGGVGACGEDNIEGGDSIQVGACGEDNISLKDSVLTPIA